ncbi:thioredoxin family protein [Muricauda oceani]|uniref:Thioredoxin fold domain-containing protein n=1 Tax=Flagellimonas oceani TaxID=2698672 RepID=A0A6G7J0L1_9FLAO|nr:thioredoxin family protein [Allomuricauda oceani]MBW8243651.1 thioredoxin family protein [Allomuricauda oceani]QII43982.1 thioredoxin fold domain-containing protein [Allomuricauda oceani]
MVNVKTKLWFTLFFVIGVLNAQDTQPVQWTTTVERISDTEYRLISKASIEKGWHLLGQDVQGEGISPTMFLYDVDTSTKLMGNTEEKTTVKVREPLYGLMVMGFVKEAVFEQRVETLPTVSKIQGFVEYMVCDDARCLPLAEEELLFDLSAQQAKETNTNDISQGIEGTGHRKGLWSIFFIAFISGFAALLTPCVFPMIPMTVSFFTKQSKTRAQGIKNAIFYGISIVLIYVILGSLVTAVFGADSLNALSTNVWFNLIFFILLVVFAASFLGAFEIVLPYTWVNKVDRQADKGGVLGILFMALALAIVSFSCTGPIVGTLLVEAASKGGMAPIIGMFGFSLALALPFMFFALFPGWLNSLPKSGGWLNSVKVFLGFLELALAFKFLSNADLVLQLHWLEREIFIAIWIAIFGILAMYLFGKIQLPHDSQVQHISVGRLGLGILTLSFTLYLIPGLWGAPLKLVSGFPPPMQYSESPNGVGFTSSTGGSFSNKPLPEGATYGPHDIITFKDYEKGMAHAKKVGKPVLIDFTGHACVNCRKMEERVWSDPQILDILNNEVVLVSLYVDDKREMSEDQQYVSEATGKRIKTIGNKWSDFQITKYRANAQPYYVLVDGQGKSLNAPVGYTPDVEVYEAWLRQGLDTYKLQ